MNKWALLLTALVACSWKVGPFPPSGAPKYCDGDPSCPPKWNHVDGGIGHYTYYQCRFLEAYLPAGVSGYPKAQCVPVSDDPIFFSQE